MAEWNLSVRLTGQGTDLVGTLRRSSTEARRLQRDIDNARQAITRLRQSARGDIRLRVTVDTGNLRTQIQQATAGADTGLNSLRDAAQDASRALRTLRGRTAAASHELGELRTQAIAAAAGLRTLNTAAGRTDGRLEALTSRSRTFRTELDELDGSVQRVGGNLGGLRGSIGSVGASSQNASNGTQGLALAIGALGSAIIPVAASVVPLAATLGAAGASVGAFGIALAGQVGALGEAAEAQKKYDEAVRDNGPTSKEAAEAQKALQAQLAAMPAPTREASAALSSLKGQYQSWSDSLAGDTMPVAVKGFQTLSAVIPKLTPMVKGASAQMDRLITITAGGIASDSFDSLFDRFSDFANGSLKTVTDGFVHLLRVLSGDAPAGSKELKAFMEYARSVGPQVSESLKSLAKALLNIMTAAAQMGVSVLTVVEAVSKLVSAIPSGVLTAFFQLALALKAVQLATRGLSAGSAVVAAFAAQLGAARAAAAGAGGPLASAAAGFMALSRAAKAAVIGTAVGVLIIALTQLSRIGREAPPDIDRLTTSLGRFAKTGKVSGEAARVFGKDLSGLADSLRVLARPSIDEGIKKWLGDLTGIDPVNIADAKEEVDGFDKSLANMVKNGNADLAAAAFKRASKQLGNLTPKELRSKLDDYKSALADAKFEQQLAAESMGVFGQQALATSAKLDTQKASADGLRQAITALNDAHRQGLGGMIGFEAAIDAAAEAAKKNAGALTMTGGQLNLNSEKARNAATALNDLAAKTDEAATSARQSGASWESVNAIYARGRQELISNAHEMGLTKSQAEALASSILKIPSKHSTKIEMQREDAIAGLDAVIAKIKATPNAKSVTVNALTREAIALLESLGYKVKTLPDGKVQVTALTGSAMSNLSAVLAARNALRDKSVLISVTRRTIYETVQRSGGSNQAAKNAYETFRATGGPVGIGRYATGGHIQAFPTGGYIEGPGTGTSDSILGLFPAGPAMVSNTEFVIRSAAVEKYGLRFLEAVNSGRLPKFASGGSIPKLAGGGFTYDPTGSRRSVSDVQSAYSDSHQSITKAEYSKKLRARANAVDSLRAAEARLSQVRRRKHTHSQLVAAENSVAKARRSVATATEAARTAESRYKKTFSLSDWQKTLKGAVSANASWESNLSKIAARGAGGDVIDQLREMGDQGAAMVSALAKASNRQFKDIVANLRRLAPLAKATLADYTRQINASTKTSTTFQQNLSKIAAMGYGDLAMQLAGQGDEAAQKLAAEAAGSSSKAKAANTSAKNAGKTLSSEELSQLVQIIAAVKSSKTGIHDVAASTGLGEDEIVTVATKASSQIKSSLGSRSTRFLSDLTRAQKGMAYENGGIRAGLYATQGGLVRFAEPSTHGEGYVPLAPSKRASATAVLGDIAGRFGLGLTPANAGQVVVIREQGPLVGAQTWHVTSGGNAVDTARQIESRSAYQLRRLARGGAAAR
ncbi:phage tail protein [Streptomyces nigrescens]|uniref:phage tail protein n=1 Tax=Streptomyces nigrescens TaxID=1920 RepID=UPI00370332B5